MNYKELLYNKDNVLSIYPELAVVLNTYDEIKFDNQTDNDKKKKADRSGLNKAIVINQLNYWNNINENKSRNFFDGHYWSYNSYAGWSETNFPFWSPTTVKRIFNSLENDGIIVSCKNNRLKIDNTKWYRINYERLQEIINIVEEYRAECAKNRSESQNILQDDQTSGQSDQTAGPKCTDDGVIMDLPLPENNNIDYPTEINNSETTNINAHNSKELGRSIHASRDVTRSEGHIPYINPDNCTQQEFHDFILAKSMVFCKKHQGNEEAANELAKIIEYFYKQYGENMGEKHPILSDKAFENVAIRYLYPPELLESNDIYGFGHYKDMIDKYFKTDYGRHHKKKYGTEFFPELSLPHFMSDEIRINLAKKVFTIPH